MIHHLSVSARDPKAVADFLVDLTGGFVVDFRPCPGAFMVFIGDAHGTAVEIYPAGILLAPDGPSGGAFISSPPAEGDHPENGGGAPVPRTPTHFALGVEADLAAVLTLAAVRGWECHVCDRGGHFHVVEVWIENTWLLEVLPPAFAAEYLGFTAQVVRMADPNGPPAPHAPNTRTPENA